MWRSRDLRDRWNGGPVWVRLTAESLPIKVRNANGVVLSMVFVAFIFVASLWDAQLNDTSEPLDIALGVAIIILVPVIGVWWYRVSQELCQFERLHALSSPARPIVSALGVTLGWYLVLPPIIAGFRLGRRLRRSQLIAGMNEELCRPWVVGVGVVPLSFPILATYVQRRLNGVWAKCGEEMRFGDPSMDLSELEVDRRVGDGLDAQ